MKNNMPDPSPVKKLAFTPPSAGDLVRRQKEDERRKAQAHSIKVAELRSKWCAPRRHVECKPVKTGLWGAALDSLVARIGTGFLSGLVGPRGPGKTQLAVELMKAAVEMERSARLTTAVGFFLRVKASWRKDSDIGELDTQLSFLSPSLLVIDEIGKRAETEWENNLLFELINNRYSELKDTLLIDNRTPDEFLATLGPSMSSRMLETGGVIEANWESFRK